MLEMLKSQYFHSFYHITICFVVIILFDQITRQCKHNGDTVRHWYMVEREEYFFLDFNENYLEFSMNLINKTG